MVAFSCIHSISKTLKVHVMIKIILGLVSPSESLKDMLLFCHDQDSIKSTRHWKWHLDLLSYSWLYTSEVLKVTLYNNWTHTPTGIGSNICNIWQCLANVLIILNAILEYIIFNLVCKQMKFKVIQNGKCTLSFS